MITRILVPTDFSPAADNALRYAIHFAEKTGAKLHLLHAINIPVGDAYFVAGSYFTLINELEKVAEEGFTKLKKKILKSVDFKQKTVVSAGYAPSAIEDYAKKEKIDLIIMGTSGASGLKEVFFGSNAASTISASDVPVLVIPPKARYHELKDLIYATDYTEPEFPAVSRLIYLAELYRARVTVLHVKSEYDQYFDSAKNFFVKNKSNISYKRWKMARTRGENAMEGISNYLADNSTDLLVVAKHNRSFFDRIFHRSLSKRMAYHTHIPLLVLNKDVK